MSAIVLSHNRRESVQLVLERLAELPLEEVIVVDNGSTDGVGELVAHWGGNVSLLEIGRNIGVAARNLAARQARSELLLMLDDDSYPLTGALEALVPAFGRDPRLGVAGGRIVDVDLSGALRDDGAAPGSFDWFLRPPCNGVVPNDGVPAFFFAQCGCVVRRRAFLEVGGCFEPYFFYGEELDLTARMVAAGWRVAYFPGATFAHRRGQQGEQSDAAIRRMLRYRIRNQIWYFWLRFPLSVAARRIPAYLAFDFVECVYRGELRTWGEGVWNAWSQRQRVQGQRRPLPRVALRRAERDRGRRHLRLLATLARRSVLSPSSRPASRKTGAP